MTLDTKEYITLTVNRQGKLTYTKHRGFHHWLCLKCGRQERERIPDQADSEYCHNPANPIMAVCGKCNGGTSTARIKLNGRLPQPTEPQDGDNPLSYDQLQGEWRDWLEVACKYEHKVPAQDRYDIRHIIMIELAKARARDGEPIPTLRAYRIASLTVALYWRQLKRQPTMLSLNTEIDDGDGNTTELMETVADDKAIDLDAWLDARTWLLGCPKRLIDIAHKRLNGIPLNAKDKMYLQRFRQREQKRLF